MEQCRPVRANAYCPDMFQYVPFCATNRAVFFANKGLFSKKHVPICIFLYLCAPHKVRAVLGAMARPKIYLKTRAGEREGQLWLCHSLGGGRRHYNAGYWKSGTKRPVRGGHVFSEQYNALLSEMEQFAATLSVAERVRDPAEMKRRLSERFGGGQGAAAVPVRPWADGDFISYCGHVLSERRSGRRTVTGGAGNGHPYRPSWATWPRRSPRCGRSRRTGARGRFRSRT